MQPTKEGLQKMEVKASRLGKRKKYPFRDLIPETFGDLVPELEKYPFRDLVPELQKYPFRDLIPEIFRDLLPET